MGEIGIDTEARIENQHDRELVSVSAGVVALGESVEVDYFNDLSGNDQIAFPD